MTNITKTYSCLFLQYFGHSFSGIGFLNPIIAGAAMALSSISVLSNALRLKRVKID